MNSDSSVIKDHPQPPFKIEVANIQLKQPKATADIGLTFGTYTFTDTFVILSKTSFPTIGLNFIRNQQTVIDTASLTINLPQVEMTLAMTDEMKNCNPKPLKLLAEGQQTLLPQQTTTVNAAVITTNTNNVTSGVQPLPQCDESATTIVGNNPQQKNKHQNSQPERFSAHNKESHKIGGSTNPQASIHQANTTH